MLLLDDELTRVDRLVEGVKQARLALAELTLQALRGDVDDETRREIAQRGITALVEATRRLEPGETPGPDTPPV